MSSVRQRIGQVSPATNPRVSVVGKGTLNVRRGHRFQDRVKETCAVRRKLSVEEKLSMKEDQDDVLVVVAQALNAASRGFCAQELSNGDEQFFESALTTAVEGSLQSLIDIEADYLISEESTSAEPIDFLIDRSRQVILKQRREILCLRLMVQELIHGVLNSKDDRVDDSHLFPPNQRLDEKSGATVRTPSTANTTMTSTPSTADFKDELKVTSSSERCTPPAQAYALKDIQRSLNATLERQQLWAPSQEGNRSPRERAHSIIAGWEARHTVRRGESSPPSESSSGISQKGYMVEPQSEKPTFRHLDANVSVDSWLVFPDPFEENSETTIMHKRETAVQSTKGGKVTENQQSTLFTGKVIKIDRSPRDSRMEPEGMVDHTALTTAVVDGSASNATRASVMGNSINSDDLVFEDSEDDSDQEIHNTAGRRMVVLIAGTPINRAQQSMQERAVAILQENGVHSDFVNGANPAEYNVRDTLFDLSGLYGAYPQLFLVEDDGTAEFFGDFEKLMRLSNSGELRSIWRESTAQTPSSQPMSVSTTSSMRIGQLPETRKAGSIPVKFRSEGNAAMLDRTIDESLDADTTTDTSYEMIQVGNRELRWI